MRFRVHQSVEDCLRLQVGRLARINKTPNGACCISLTHVFFLSHIPLHCWVCGRQYFTAKSVSDYLFCPASETQRPCDHNQSIGPGVCSPVPSAPTLRS